MNSLKYKRILSLLTLPLFLSFLVQYITVLLINTLKNLNISDFYKTFFLPQLIYPLLFLGVYIITSKILLKEDFSSLSFKGNIKPCATLELSVLFISASIVLSSVFGAIIELINSKETIIKPLSFSLIEPQGLTESILFIFVMTVIPAIVEETIFRGIILSNLSKYVGKFSIILSSILFAFMHGNFNQIPVAFIMGLILSYCAYRYKSLLLPIFIHFLNNFFSALFQVLRCNISKQTYKTADNIIAIIFLVLALLILLFEICRKNRKRLFEKEEKIDKGMIKASFTNIGLILYVAFNLFIAVSLNI